jgi:N utilization substance protein B
MGSRHQARELALKVLFQVDADGEEADQAIRYQAGEDGASSEAAAFAAELVHGVLQNQEQLDAAIADASRNWKLEQMAKVDRVVLRIAIYEIAISRSVPVRAAINESIELAKTFSGEESGRFVNGILGKIAAGVKS